MNPEIYKQAVRKHRRLNRGPHLRDWEAMNRAADFVERWRDPAMIVLLIAIIAFGNEIIGEERLERRIDYVEAQR